MRIRDFLGGFLAFLMLLGLFYFVASYDYPEITEECYDIYIVNGEEKYCNHISGSFGSLRLTRCIDGNRYYDVPVIDTGRRKCFEVENE